MFKLFPLIWGKDEKSVLYPLPKPEQLPPDELMRQIEELSLDDDVKAIRVIILTDVQCEMTYQLLNRLKDLLVQHGADEDEIKSLNSLAERFEAHADDEDQEEAAADQQVDPELDPAYAFDRKAKV